MLAVIIVLIIVAAILGITIYSKTVKDNDTRPMPQRQCCSRKGQRDSGQREQTDGDSQGDREGKPPDRGDTKETESEPQTEPQTKAPEQESTEVPTLEQTEYVQETDPPEPVYKTMQGGCYLRSAPSYEGEIIGSTGPEPQWNSWRMWGGWYKVRVDGKTGVYGSKIFLIQRIRNQCVSGYVRLLIIYCSSDKGAGTSICEVPAPSGTPGGRQRLNHR